jgi:catechol 2,3-dioxygenase-like lactoylglutathione lyase family enzyme
MYTPVSSYQIPSFYRMASAHAATIKALDHLVLTVKSIPETTEWYTKHLGMRAESFVSAATLDTTRHSLIFGQQKINLHELGKGPIVFFGHLFLGPGEKGKGVTDC